MAQQATVLAREKIHKASAVMAKAMTIELIPIPQGGWWTPAERRIIDFSEEMFREYCGFPTTKEIGTKFGICSQAVKNQFQLMRAKQRLLEHHCQLAFVQTLPSIRKIETPFLLTTGREWSRAEMRIILYARERFLAKRSFPTVADIAAHCAVSPSTIKCQIHRMTETHPPFERIFQLPFLAVPEVES